MGRRKVSHLILDFDETLTVSDTITTLSTLAYTNRASPAPPPWSFFVQSYLTDLANHTATLPPAAARNTIAQEAEYLRSLRPVEEASIERIERYGVFQGVKIAALAGASAGVDTRDGWWRAVRAVARRGGNVDVVSVNWSRDWVRNVLSHAAGEDVAGIGIHSNDLITTEVDRERTCTGAFDRYFGSAGGGVWTADDKLRIMKQLVAADEEGLRVYVGDSSTDLLCLLEADVGVVFGGKLDKVCGRLGIGLKMGFGDWGGIAQGDGRVLWRVDHWDEVAEWLDVGDGNI
ncbi:hypothetical protein RUND412_002539 [Rhizina undulata]